MTSLKKVCLVMVVVILLGVTTVFATGDVIMINQSNTVVGGNTVNTTPKNTVIQTGNTSKYSNTTNLPKTGADDYAVIAIIAVLGVGAVYAFKKISDYKNI